jgi:hypothetical protein
MWRLLFHEATVPGGPPYSVLRSCSVMHPWGHRPVKQLICGSALYPLARRVGVMTRRASERKRRVGYAVLGIILASWREVSGTTALRRVPWRPTKDGGGGEEPDGSEGRQTAMSGKLLATVISGVCVLLRGDTEWVVFLLTNPVKEPLSGRM